MDIKRLHLKGHFENIEEGEPKLQKEKAHAEYTEANNDVKKSVRKDERKFIDDLAKEAEAAATQHNMKTLSYN